MTDIKVIQGEFFTPDIWAKKSHEYIENELGSDWKEKYVVWDCAAGHGALVKDLKFERLFQSTINQHDVDYLNDNFKDSQNFQFDFLNDDEEKIPLGLRQLLEENFPIIFYINPPFGKTYTSIEQYASEREYFPSTKLFLETLDKEKFGKSSSSQLYIQFIYKIMMLKEKYNLTKIKLALFAPPFFLTGGTFQKFRKRFVEEFLWKSGFLMDAKNFDAVSSWRLSFTIFDGLSDENIFRRADNFLYDILELENDEIKVFGKKNIYNLDNKQQALKWIKEGIPKAQLDCPQISNPLKFKDDGRGYMVPDALGFFYNDTNYVKTNVQGVALFSTGFYKGLGSPVTKENLLKVAALFTARRVFLHPKWFETHDEYMVPDETKRTGNFIRDREDTDYNIWNNAALIYSLFNNKSFQTSLRGIDYKDKKWDINNHFFWLSKEYVYDLAKKYNNEKILKDLSNAEDTYVYNYLDSILKNDSITKHPMAISVLESIKNLFEKSFASRENFDEKYQLNTWDAGYAQLKWLWKKEFKEDYKDFKKKYKALENELGSYIYAFGFLKPFVKINKGA